MNARTAVLSVSLLALILLHVPTLAGVLYHPELEIEDVVFGSDHVIVSVGAHEHLFLLRVLDDTQSNGGVSLCPPFSCWSGIGVS